MLQTHVAQKIRGLSIGQRVMAGFSLMLAIGLLATIFTSFNQKTIRDLFVEFNRISEDATSMLEIDNGIIKLQRQILIFGQAKNASAISQVSELYGNLLLEIKRLDVRHDSFDESDKVLLGNLLLSMVQFGENIDSLEEQRAQADAMDAELTKIYDNTHRVIVELLLYAENSKSSDASVLIRKAQGEFSRSEALGSRYLHKHNFQDKSQATNGLNRAVDFITQAAALENENVVQKEILDVLAMLNQVKNVFFKAIQSDRNYMFLVNIVIAGEISIIRDMSAQLSTHFLDRQRRIFSTTTTSLNLSKYISWSISLFSAIFALTAAVTIGRSISRPIKRITSTFAELAKGVNLQTIPEMNRADEIGELASAANVFREINEKTQSLLRQSELLTDDLERRKEDLQRSNKELDNFAYVASHDLKAPLRAVDNLAQWIKEDCAEILPKDSKGHLDTLQGRILRMENLLADLLNYSRVGRVDSKIDTLNIRLVIDEAIELSNKPQSFIFHIPENLPEASICVAPLVQVFQNLFTNAIKYNDKEKGEVFILVDDSDEMYFQFTVTDNGPGIEQRYHERIFMMFQTLEARDVIEASGMGLAIVKKVVENEGGKVRVESELGSGSSFIFTWPKNGTAL